MQPARAIIFFVRDERLEGTLKPLPGTYRAGGYRRLNGRVMARLAGFSSRGIDIIIATDGGERAPGRLLQRGTSFGERLGNVLTDAFGMGYSQVAVVGNDCPELAPADIEAAFAKLSEGSPLAAAPTSDGGAFLIAARAEAFDFGRFRTLPWQTSGLFEALMQLPGATALPILREDFDDWSIPSARRALDRLFVGFRPLVVAALSHQPVSSPWRHKALTRSFITSPPLS